MIREVIVLAGGLGTRLRDVVRDVPKPLAPVAGRPFLAWVLDQLCLENVDHIILATGHMAALVERSIGSSWNGVPVTYAIEYEPLGTGGAIRFAAGFTQGRGVHVVNGDTYLRYSMKRLEHSLDQEGPAMAMALAFVEDTFRYGRVQVDEGRVVAFEEKGCSGPGLINAGCYYLGPRALQALPAVDKFSFELDFLRGQIREAGIVGYSETEAFIDIGIPSDYARAQYVFATAK